MKKDYKKVIRNTFYDLCSNADSPSSLGKWISYCMAPKELTMASINPLDYSDPVSFGFDYACHTFLRKYVGLDTGIDKQSEAFSKFGNSERKCSETNGNLQVAIVTGRLARIDSDILFRIKNKIAAVWGSPSFREIFDHCGWGPGSTSTLRGEKSTREDKMSQFPVSITPAAIPYFTQVVSHDIQWLRHLLKQDVAGRCSLLPSCFRSTQTSRLLTVPKDSGTDRTICAEPTANIYLQKGIGKYLRKRLKRFGVDLDSQFVNQELARLAITLGLSTLDLKSASDTVAIMLCKLLCPSEMFELLNSLRTPSYRYKGVETRFHKFSSMGNGFTFELESLIFYAVVSSIAEAKGSDKPLGIYGDDIVCDRAIVPEVVMCLEDLGFELNMNKSFIDGRFFESCGKHYFDGHDVTPPYQKSEVSDDSEYIRLANRIFDWLLRMDKISPGFLKSYGKIHNRLLRNARPKIKNLKGFWWLEGDGFFRTHHDPCLSFDMSMGYNLRFLSERAPSGRLADGGLYADELRKASMSKTWHDTQPTKGKVIPRNNGGKAKHKIRKRRVQLFGRTACYNSFITN